MQNELVSIRKKGENYAARLACKQGETLHVPVPCDQSYLNKVSSRSTLNSEEVIYNSLLRKNDEERT